MLLDQLQTEYRDRFIRLEYVWALKYSPTQARDKDGQWVKGGGGPKLPEAPMTSRLRTFWPETTNPLETGFLLYDGTRIHKRPEVTHAEMAAGPRGRLQYRPGSEQLEDLFVLLDEGVIRYVPGEGVYLSRKPSEVQAQTIIDDWNTYYPNKLLRVDFVLPGTEGGVASYKEFPTDVTVDALRHWVHDQQYITAVTQRALKFDPTQPRDKNGRWVLDKSGQPLTVYHGSVSPDVTGSKLNPNQPPVRPRSGPNGIYFTSSAQSAYNYIRMPGAGIKGPKGRVIPANIRMNNPLDITDAIKKGQKKGLSFGEAKRKALEDLTPDHDGVIFRGDDYNPDEYIVFSADQIGPVQSIAKKFVEILKYDPNQPRGKGGKWVKGGGSGPTMTETNDGYQRTLTMTVDGKVVGSAKYHLSSYNKTLMEFDILHIDPKARDKGHGEQLYRAVVERAKELGATELLGDVTSSGVLRLGIKVMGQPNYIADAIREYTLDEAMKQLEPLAPENAEGIIDTGNYLAVRWSLGAKKWDETKHPRDKEGQFAESGVPKEPGTTPIPPGKIRAYHYTEDMDAVEREGLDVTKAKGHTYGEPDAIWFSTEKPGDFKNYVEVFLDPEEVGIGRPSMVVKRNGEWRNAETPEEHQEVLDEYNKGNHNLMVFPKQIKPDRFVTTHRPWHYHYRYLTKDPEQVKAIVAGEYDWGLDNPEYAPAIRAIKAHYGKGK